MWHVAPDTWHVTPNTWHVTPDKWHMTFDTLHVTGEGRWNFFQGFIYLTVLEWRFNEYNFRNHDRMNEWMKEWTNEWMNEWMNYKGDCRTAPGYTGTVNHTLCACMSVEMFIENIPYLLFVHYHCLVQMSVPAEADGSSAGTSPESTVSRGQGQSSSCQPSLYWPRSWKYTWMSQELCHFNNFQIWADIPPGWLPLSLTFTDWWRHKHSWGRLTKAMN